MAGRELCVRAGIQNISPYLIKFVLCVCVFVLFAHTASGQEDAGREQLEEDMFGGEEEPVKDSASKDVKPKAEGSGEALEDEMFGGGEESGTDTNSSTVGGSGDDMAARLAEMDRGVTADYSASFADTMAIGGRLFMQVIQSIREDNDINSADLSSPNLLDVYLDARPTDRVRTYVRGRVTHDFTVREGEVGALGQAQDQTRVDLNQLWLKFDIGRVVFVTLGRQPIRWGSARFWNPTDFMNQTIRDPLAVFDVRGGVSLLKLHIPLESEGWNFYIIGDFEGASTAGQVGGAVRMEYLFDVTEIALSASARQDNPYRIGLDISTSLGLFDFHVEGAVRYNDKTTYWDGSFDPYAFKVPTAQDRSGEWLTQVAANVELGLKYSDEDSVYLGVEYLFNQTGYGYRNGDLLPWMIFQGQYRPLYAGQHYGAFYVNLPSPGSWNDTTFILSNLGNLSDLSFQTRFDYRVNVLTYLSLNTFATVHYGDLGEFHLGIDVPPIPPQLPNGFKLSKPITEVGFSAQLNF